MGTTCLEEGYLSGMKPLASRLENIRPSGIRKYFDLKRENLISLAGGTIQIDPFEHVHEAAKQAIDAGFTGYTTNSGIIPLREAVASKLERENNVHYEPDEILVTCGSSEALAAIPLAVMEPGDEAIILDPYYIAFGPLVELAGGKPIYVPTRPENNWFPDPEEVERAISPFTKLIFLMSPGNPTGAVLSEESTRALAEIAVKHDLYVASDELYERIVFDGMKVVSPAALPGMRERTFTVNGFSKGFGMTGWRVGYVACPTPLIAALIKAQQYASICAPSVSQYAALAALTGPPEAFERLLSELERRRRFVSDELDAIEGLRCRPQDGTFYTFVDARALLQEIGDSMRASLKEFPNYELPASESEQLIDYLVLQGNVVLTAGSTFGKCGEGWFRISEADRMETLALGVERIREALEAL